mmetsp:Transcript_57935/g.137988  ORF Transcript_57935/g.137988 Transcript_57935/m.137988 type:complete len:367 (-) Transcript_57935:1365-2465(-)
MEANLLAEHGGEDVHTKPLSHGLTQDGEAAVGDGGAQQAAHSDDDKQQRHELQVGTHLLLVRLVEGVHGAHQGHGAHGHRRAGHQGTQHRGHEEGPLGPVVTEEPSHGHLVGSGDLPLPVGFSLLLPPHALGLGLPGVCGGALGVQGLVARHRGHFHRLFRIRLVDRLLCRDQGVVGALLLHETCMAPLLHQLAAAEDINEVRTAHCTQAVGNTHNTQTISRTCTDAVDGGLDHLLRSIIQSAGGLIQEEERGLLQQSPGNCDALLLASRKLTPGTTHKGVVLLGQRVNKAKLGIGTDLGEVFLTCRRVTLHDVVVDGAGKKNRLLSHVANAPSQRRHFKISHALAIHQYFSGVRVIEALQQSHNG